MQLSTIHPRLILLLSLILPASGHVIIGQAKRGLQFLFFMIIFAWIGNRIFPDQSFFFRHSGAILIYGFIAIDAYKLAMHKRHLSE